ncbi:DNA repair protein rhp26 [Umbelopsis sp. WA50703]
MDNYTVSESSKMAENSSSSAQASNETSPVSVIEEVPNDQIPSSDKGGELQDLGVDFVDQNVLERELMAKADKAINAREDELDEKRLVKAAKEIDAAQKLLASLKKRMNEKSMSTFEKDRVLAKINEQVVRLRNAKKDEREIKERMEDRKKLARSTNSQAIHENQRGVNESEREFLIRTGKITPFARMSGLEKSQNAVDEDVTITGQALDIVSSDRSHRDLRRKSYQDFLPKQITKDKETTQYKAKKRKRRRSSASLPTSQSSGSEFDPDKTSDFEDEEELMDLDEKKEPLLDDDILNDDMEENDTCLQDGQVAVINDDGIEANFQDRLYRWSLNRQLLRYKLQHPEASNMTSHELEETLSVNGDLDVESEIYKPHPAIEDVAFEGDIRIPGELYNDLFDYQKTCVQWLWELYCQEAGGIIGDEMGLGKTIQIIAFVAGLHHSRILGPDRPVLVVCPATVLKQWVKEFHRWWPPMRVAILHSSGSGLRSSYQSDRDLEDQDEELLRNFHIDEENDDNDERYMDRRARGNGGKKVTKSRVSILTTKTGRNAAALVDRYYQTGGVIVTTFAGIRTYREILVRRKWGYVVLDEGHKIRNPDSEVTLACKQLKTPHRMILSGTPIQNNLTELWSLFDFVFPGRLGTLPVFQTQFSIPINIGGYANATNVQVQTAYKCACVLRDLINPYLLRRMKADVAADLPKKSEQVLFCKLTPSQRRAYEEFIKSKDMESIMIGRRQVLFGIDIVRKICNHPDILNRDRRDEIENYGDPEKSGKMVVVRALLSLWKKEGHRVLLFSQTRQMLDILEIMIQNLGHRYLRMDGTTAIQNRMSMVDQYNANSDIFVFLLTTKVGGLGLNLTGADRVIIFDPDWNPSTDVQARERAWRLGQKRSVTIYRLMTSGTIEEKIYHRQIFKQFLTNKILKDPKQKRFFDASNLQNLFTLSADDATGTETGDLFKNSEVTASSSKKKKRSKKKMATNDDAIENLQALEGFSKLEKFNQEADDNDGSEQDSDNENNDNILNSLFEMTGIQSAIQHDQIVDSAGQERMIVDREASRIAERAAEALKESRRRLHRSQIGTPTWTGRSGSAGAPRRPETSSSTPPPRFGSKIRPTGTLQRPASSSPVGSPRFGSGTVSGFKALSRNRGPMASSGDILSQMKERKALEQEVGSSTPSSQINSPDILLNDSNREGLIVKIRDYLHDHGGIASSADIISNLQLNIPKEQVVVFRKMLQAIARFERDETDEQSGRGMWVLREEYY